MHFSKDETWKVEELFRGVGAQTRRICGVNDSHAAGILGLGIAHQDQATVRYFQVSFACDSDEFAVSI